MESSSQPNAVDLSASYVENSPALGVLFVLVLTNGVGDMDTNQPMDVNQPIYLVLDRESSDQFMQENITQGDYTVLAFDVESDGTLVLGIHSPAAVGSVVVHGEGECVLMFM